jgi:hypothetical protein
MILRNVDHLHVRALAPAMRAMGRIVEKKRIVMWAIIEEINLEVWVTGSVVFLID